MKISSVATVGKSLAIKREKDEDEGERVVAHLKFTDCFVSREEVDALCGQPEGWSRRSLFDELGAPIAKLEIAILKRDLTASVKLSDQGTEMHVAGGKLTGMALLLNKSGALLSGELSWLVAGDEVSDVETILGQIVRADLNLTDGEQGDLLRTRDAINSLRKSMAESGGGSLSVIGDDGKEEVLLKVEAKGKKAA